MIITLTPQIRGDHITIAKHGDALTINGTDYDFAPLPEGAVLPASAVACEHIVGDVTRIGGQIHLTVLLPIAWDAPLEARFPGPIIDPPDGPIALPGAEYVD